MASNSRTFEGNGKGRFGGLDFGQVSELALEVNALQKSNLAIQEELEATPSGQIKSKPSPMINLEENWKNIRKAWVHWAVAECPEISLAARAVYAIMAASAGKDRQVSMSLKLISARAGVTYRAARKYVSELKEFGVLARISGEGARITRWELFNYPQTDKSRQVDSEWAALDGNISRVK